MLERAEGPQRGFGVVNQRALGDFELERARRQAALIQGIAHQVKQIGALELARREVDAGGETRLEGAAPASRLIAGFAEHPFVELKDETGLLCQGEELMRGQL